MIRFAVILYFFVHLWVRLKAPRLTWPSRVVGCGISAFFAWLVVSGAEPNSNIVLTLIAILTAIGVVAAEFVAFIVKKRA